MNRKNYLIMLAAVISVLLSLCLIEVALWVFPNINRKFFHYVSWNHWKIGNNLKQSKVAIDTYNKGYAYDKDVGYVNADAIKAIKEDEGAISTYSSKILILGDSVSENGQYVDMVKNKIRADHLPGVDFFNAGIIGYDTKMEYSFLKKYGVEYKPDVVILQFNVNDFHGTPLIMKQSDGTWVAYDREFSDIFVNQFLFERSELYKLYIMTRMRFHRKEPSPVDMVKPYLKAMSDYLKEQGVAFVIVYFPMFDEGSERDKRHTLFYSIVYELGLEQNVIDLTSTYDLYENEQISNDAWHPNVLGDQIAAEEIYKHIKPLIENSREDAP